MSEVMERHESGVPDISAIKRAGDRRKLQDAMENLHHYESEVRKAKDTIDAILLKFDMKQVQHGKLRASRIEGVKETPDVKALLAAGVRASVIAKSAWGVSKGKLIENGAAADIVQDCTKRTEYVQVRVQEVKK